MRSPTPVLLLVVALASPLAFGGATENTPPLAAFDLPDFVRPYVPVQATDRSTDADGHVVSVSFSKGDGSPAQSVAVGGTFNVTYTSEGYHLAQLTAVDDAGASHATAKAVGVDGQPPRTYLHVPTPPADGNGWFREPVTVGVERVDDGVSRVRATSVFVTTGSALDVHDLPGESDASVVVGLDGRSLVVARSFDHAGNWGTQDAVTVRVDTSPPEAWFARPRIVNHTDSPVGVFVQQESAEFRVFASDRHSDVAGVTVHVAGDTVPCALHVQDWSWRCFWEPRPGVHEAFAVATNGAGLTQTTATIWVVVV